MSTVTKEQLIEDLKSSTQNANGMFEIGEDTICALMEHLLAVEGQEPVISVIFKGGWPIPETVGIVAGGEKLPDGVYEFYAAPQPAPVAQPVQVPDDVVKSLDFLLRRSYFRRWVKDPVGYVAGSIPVSDLVNVVLFAETCRAAMLQAGNSPVSPDGWVACSERMPGSQDGVS